MASKNDSMILSEAFLQDLFKTCMDDSYILSVVAQYFEPEHMPDRNTTLVLKAFKEYYFQYNRNPTYSLIKERLSGKSGAVKFLDSAYNTGIALADDECLDSIEKYLKSVEFQKAFKKAQEKFNSSGFDKGFDEISKFVDWERSFSLLSSDYTNVIDTFLSRHTKNRTKSNTRGNMPAITRFYIDELDAMNQDRDLRTQLTCILALTGVGKSHAARWIGSQACKDGLNVLHFQLEGSGEEVENAYSAAIANCNAYAYEKGFIKDSDIQAMDEQLQQITGKLFVRSYPRFNMNVSTVDIKESISEFRKNYGVNPDVVIVDSMNLLTDASKGKDVKDERNKRIAVANNLKDLAADEKVWMVVTYQSTIEHPDWLNDEKNVLTEYNCSEAKSISQPLTHLITLNVSANERKEKTMRLHVAKSRFFPKGETFKIATNYDCEQFYDAVRTLNLTCNDNRQRRKGLPY